MPCSALHPPTPHPRQRPPLFSLLLIGLVFFSTTLVGQVAGPEIRTALRRAYEKGNYLTAITQRNWRRGLNVAAAALPAGRAITLSLPLEAGEQYTFLASSTTERSVLDLRVYSPAGEVVASDTADDATPIVVFTCRATGDYQLQLYLRAADEPQLAVAVALLQRSGVVVPSRDFRDLTATFFASSEAVTGQAADLRWVTGERWCVFGLHLPDGLTLDLGGQLVASTGTYFALTGPPNLDNIRLYLADAAGRIASSSGQGSAFPVLHHAAEQNTPFTLRIDSGRRRATGQLLLGVFEL